MRKGPRASSERARLVYRSCKPAWITYTASIEMENFFDAGPPFILSPGFKRLLHWHHDRPPLLCFRIGCHSSHVRGIICAVIFVVAEQQAVLQKNRIIANVTFLDHGQYFRPYRGMVFLVFV